MSTNKYDNQFKKKFSSLEKKLRNRQDAISDIMNSALASDRTDKAYWKGVNSSLNKEYKKVSALCTDWSYEEIPKQYRFVLREQMAKARNLKSITNTAKKSISQLLKSDKSKKIQATLAQAGVNDINKGLLLGRKSMDTLLKQKRQYSIAKKFTSKSLEREIKKGNVSISKTRRTITKRLLKANKDKKYITVINKNGQPIMYKIPYYSEMVFRVAWHEAQSAAVKTNNVNWGTDLIRVSSHNTTTAICQQYEGKIFSLNGKNKDFPIADQTPPYHVNCLHYITTTFEESLKVQGNYEDYAKFSNNETNKPPGQEGFVPVKKRNAITDKAINETKKSKKYENSTPRQKRILIRDNVGDAIGKAARDQIS
jgi:hypothetical protein